MISISIISINDLEPPAGILFYNWLADILLCLDSDCIFGYLGTTDRHPFLGRVLFVGKAFKYPIQIFLLEPFAEILFC